MPANVPLFDLKAQHASIRAELDAAIARVIESGRFIGGDELAAFESEFAAYCETEHCIGVSSGTDALTLGLQAAGVGAGDEVITTPLTFIATAESILLLGATPVLADVDPDTGLLDPAAVEAAIGERTAAIVPVHLWGQPADMTRFRQLADEHDLILVEDAAQAHGAAWDGHRAGSLGDVATFSFFPGKNLGALGDAGGVTTGDDAIAAAVSSLRDHGRAEKHRHDRVGTNARLDPLQAAVLRAKLAHLDGWNEARRSHAARYDEAFAGIAGVDPIEVGAGASSCYHQYVVRVSERDRVASHLGAAGISTGVHYPVPIHRQPALAEVIGELSFPNAERLADRVLSLPVSPELAAEDLDRVAVAVAEAVGAAAPARPKETAGSA